MSDELIDEICKNAQNLLNTNEYEIEYIKNEFKKIYDNLKELKEEEKFLNRPEDNIDLPFFAYGMFKPNQLAFPKIKDYVSDYSKEETNRKLFARDGIPFLDDKKSSEEGVKTRGFKIEFKDGDVEDAYDVIRKFEPKKYYKWEKIDVKSGGKAWALVGRHPSRSHPREIEGGTYDGTYDIYFTSVPKLITDDMKCYEPSIDIKVFLKLLRNYMLLWAAIERFLSLKYGEGVKTQNNKKLANEPVFSNSLKKYVSEKRKVFRTDNLEPVKLNPNNSKNSIDYYYTVRSNVVHRGKIVNDIDERTLRKSLLELLNIFQDVLEDSFKEVKFQDRLSVDIGEK